MRQAPGETGGLQENVPRSSLAGYLTLLTLLSCDYGKPVNNHHNSIDAVSISTFILLFLCNDHAMICLLLANPLPFPISFTLSSLLRTSPAPLLLSRPPSNRNRLSRHMQYLMIRLL